MMVAIVGGQTFELNLELRASVISLDEIVVTWFVGGH